MKAVAIQISGDQQPIITLLWELGTVGIIESETSLQAFFADNADLSTLTEKYACHPMEITADSYTPQMDPSDAVRDDLIFAGEKFAIGSASNSQDPPPDRILIRIDAQNAFGSGSHESTQLVIRALEQYVLPTSTLLDVGSGSGVLSAVAQHLGAKSIIACDTHFDALLLTRHHAPGVAVFSGSIDAIASNSVNLVVANISARVIDTLASHLNRVASPEGWLILSGFIAENPPRSFLPTLETSHGEWRCWVCKPQESTMDSTEFPSNSLQPFATEWW